VSGNLSEASVFLHTKIPVPLGTNIRMLLIKPPHFHKITVDGIVKRSKGIEGLSIEFKQVSPSATLDRPVHGALTRKRFGVIPPEPKPSQKSILVVAQRRVRRQPL
jgi:hypothetical protein